MSSNQGVLMAAQRLAKQKDLEVIVAAKLEEEMAVLLACDPEGEVHPRRSLTRIQAFNELVDYVNDLALERFEAS